jgi:hypothetical protein
VVGPLKASSFAGGFAESTFRDAVYNTMLMGMPEAVEERLTFWWERDKTYTPDDPAGNPYDWTAPPIVDDAGNPVLPDPGTPTDQSLIVPYALEFSARPAGSSNTVFGEIDTSRAVVTIIDSDFDKVRTADYATIADTRYRIQFKGPPTGLFAVTVHALYLEAEDSS